MLGYITQEFGGCAVGYFKLHSSFVFIESKRQRIPFAGQRRGAWHRMLLARQAYFQMRTIIPRDNMSRQSHGGTGMYYCAVEFVLIVSKRDTFMPASGVPYNCYWRSYNYCTISIYSVRPCDRDTFDGFGNSVSTFEHCDRSKKFGRSGKN